jgi:antitoxin HicB
MQYYARIVNRHGSFLVSFPDLPSINTYGETLQEALANAEEALNGSLESDFERGFSLPAPTKPIGKYYHAIPLLPHLDIAFTLRRLRSSKSQTEIAQQLGISYQAYQKLENPRLCNPTIKTLEKIGPMLGIRIDLELSRE